MKGFKEFLLRGNLVDLAVAVIIAGAFGEVVKAFTKIVMDFIGMFGGTPDFSQLAIGPINVGVFVTALVSFVVIAAIVYFGVITPYTKLLEKFKKEEVADEAPAGPTQEELLAEIRDLLKK